jgi:hypothetical protein
MSGKTQARTEALLAELERARNAYARAEMRARTYLVERGVIELTHKDVASELARLRGDEDKARKVRKLRQSRSSGASRAGSGG